MILLVLGGIAVGLLMGALGGGGAILAIPLLVFGLGLSPQEATVISLIVVGVGAVTGAASHAKAGNVRLRQGLLFGLLGAGGAFIGTRLAQGINGDFLLVMFAVLLVVVAATMIRKALGTGRAETRETPMDARGVTLLVCAASGVGFLTGFFGVGGGFAIVPALVLVLGFDMTAAVGTSLLVIAVNSAISFAMHADQAASLRWDLAIPFAATVMAATLIGGWLGKRVPKKGLQLGFASFLLVAAAYTASQSLPNLF
ncbi:sulfite exporter TauE/SafE family protein [Falsarthrobacter nasiphocae]|uniref:Probable membrane transporter protein n=1 Tax=Falsarthrobacter nasiphocae TaxID=189863 RepID=A0AAE3YH47_9MICC|nr:sulfite exporter TauE/SafE family protein [Falsarthrobacter nasiphocae]MDR6892182.1 putative membrane protein YfcA [Falsarthrobacter nasiphocae]